MKLTFTRYTLAMCLIFLILGKSFAQNPIPQASKYSRSSITPIYIRHAGSDLSLYNYVDSAKLSDKYDQNYIGNNTMDVVFKMISDARVKYYELTDRRSANAKTMSPDEYKAISAEITEVSKQLAFEDSIRSFQIIAKLRLSKIPNRVLSNLLIDNKLGYMTLAKLEERALYDATDSDVLQANNSERKMASIKDRAVSMLNNVYFWVYDANEYKIRADEKDARLKTHTLRGGVYLVKLDMDLLNQNGQFENLIFQEFSTSKLKAFKEFNFPVKVIFRKDFYTSATNYSIDYSGSLGSILSSAGKEKSSEVKYIFKEDSQIQQELVSGTVSDANETFTANYEPYRVKSSVFATSPIRVKIGMKEDVEIDHLFKVSEFRLDKAGNPFEKNVGWLRVKKVSDNRKKADGKMEPSVFYKVFSKGVDKGMKVQYFHETGLVFGASYNALPDNIFSGPMVNIDYITNLYPGFRVGLNFGGFTELKSPTITLAELDEFGGNLSFKGRNILGELTLQKIIQFNMLELTPYVGGYISSTRMTELTVGGVKLDDPLLLPEIIKFAYNEYGGLAGVKFGINFGKYTQLNLGYKLGFTLVSELKNDDVKEGIAIPGSLFKSPSNFSIGVRFAGF